MKAKYDKMTEAKKNKKQNLYDVFQQSLYKYSFKKGQLTNECTQFKLGVENCMPLFIKKAVMEIFISLISQKPNNTELVNIAIAQRKKINVLLRRWADDKVQ